MMHTLMKILSMSTYIQIARNMDKFSVSANAYIFNETTENALTTNEAYGVFTLPDTGVNTIQFSVSHFNRSRSHSQTMCMHQ